jgi:hypothetical protein
MRFLDFLLEAQGSGGQAAAIRTEIPPVIWWNYKIDPNSKSEIEMFDYIRDNIESFKVIFSKDLNKVKKAFNGKISDDKKIELIKSCKGFYRFLLDQNKRKSINKIEWVGDTKSGEKRSRPDIKIIHSDGFVLGVSLKSGGKMTKKLPNPILNSTINSMLDSMLGGEKTSIQKEIRDDLFKNVYSKIEGIKREDLDNFSKQKKDKFLKPFKENNPVEYENLWEMARQIVRKHILKLFNNPSYIEKIKNYIIYDWFGVDNSDVETMTVYGSQSTWRISYTLEYLMLYIDSLKKIKAKPYKDSGSVNIDLISDVIPGNKITLRLDITSAVAKNNIHGKLKDVENISLRNKDMVY